MCVRSSVQNNWMTMMVIEPFEWKLNRISDSLMWNEFEVMLYRECVRGKVVSFMRSHHSVTFHTWVEEACKRRWDTYRKWESWCVSLAPFSQSPTDRIRSSASATQGLFHGLSIDSKPRKWPSDISSAPPSHRFKTCRPIYTNTQRESNTLTLPLTWKEHLGKFPSRRSVRSRRRRTGWDFIISMPLDTCHSWNRYEETADITVAFALVITPILSAETRALVSLPWFI